MRGYIIWTKSESPERIQNVKSILAQSFIFFTSVNAITSSRVRIPFIKNLISNSFDRTGRKLLESEIGCLLSHRLVWKKIAFGKQHEGDHFLVLESDSYLEKLSLLTKAAPLIENNYDIFFWGGWHGKIQLYSSTKQKLFSSNYLIGEPYLKTVYCTYGYSLNKRAALRLLRATSRISYPVDMFKYYIFQDELRLGAIKPELISEREFSSTIRKRAPIFYRNLLINIINIKNKFVCLVR